MNKYGVLSFIHEILYETPDEILDQAEKIDQQPEAVLAVIQALKDERAAIVYRHKIQKTKEPETDKASWSTPAKRLWNNVKISIDDAKRNITNKSVVGAFIQAGLDTKARGRDGKKKMLSAIKASLDIIEDAKRTEVLNNVSGLLGSDQTKGWMEVTKSEKPHYKYL